MGDFDFLTVPQAAEKAGVSESTIIRWCEAGWLRHGRFSGLRVISPEALEDCLARHDERIERIRHEAAQKAQITIKKKPKLGVYERNSRKLERIAKEARKAIVLDVHGNPVGEIERGVK